MLPPFVEYDTPEEYKNHFEKTYCKTPTLTFDGIKVFFPKYKFEHAFFESTKRKMFRLFKIKEFWSLICYAGTATQASIDSTFDR